jgi:hypothetical protein
VDQIGQGFVPSFPYTQVVRDRKVSVEEFFESVESSARIGCWSDPDKIQISILKISEVAKAFYSSSPELHIADIS